MAAVIHSLWEKGDRNPLIMPSNIPIDDPRVRDELTRYLPEQPSPEQRRMSHSSFTDGHTVLEPIHELLESDESFVIHWRAHDSCGSARYGNPNTALPLIAAAFGIRVI